MKKSNLFLVVLFSLVFFAVNDLEAQDKSKRPSPPATATGSSGELSVTLDYSSPSVKGRKVLGKLIPNGKIWRLGANEATTFEVNQDVLVEGQALPAGKYALFSIQDGGDWTFIFNREPNQWGAYSYNQGKDALRVEVSPGKSKEMVERMAFKVEEAKSGLNVILNWEYVEVAFNVQAAK